MVKKVCLKGVFKRGVKKGVKRLRKVVKKV